MKKTEFLMLILYPYLIAAEFLIFWGLLSVVKTTQGFIGVMVAAATADAALVIMFVVMLYVTYKGIQRIKGTEYELSRLLRINKSIKLMQIVPILIMGYFLFRRYFFSIGYFGLLFLIPVTIFVPSVFLLGGRIGHIAVNKLYRNGMMGERIKLVCTMLQYVPIFDAVTAVYLYGSSINRLRSYGAQEKGHLETTVQGADENEERVLNFLILYPAFGAAMTAIAVLFMVIPDMVGVSDAVLFLSLTGRVLLPVVLILLCILTTVWNIGIHGYILGKIHQGYVGEDFLEMSLDMKMSYRRTYIIIVIDILLSLLLGTAGLIIAVALLYIACSMMWQSGMLAVKGMDDLYKRGLLTKGQIRLNRIGLFLVLFDVKTVEALRALSESDRINSVWRRK